MLVLHFCLLLNNIQLNRQATFYLFIHQISCFHFSAIRDNATVYMHVQVFVGTYAFISLGYIPKREIAGSHCNSMFNVWRTCQAVFHCGCAIFPSHQQCTQVPISPHSHQHLLSLVVFMTAILKVIPHCSSGIHFADD